MIKIITKDDLKLEEISVYFATSEVELLHRYEPMPGLFIAESPKVITRAIDAGYEPESIMICEEELHEEGRQMLKLLPEDLCIYSISSEVLHSIRGFNLTNGCMCAMKRQKNLPLEEVCRDAKRIAVLDDVENPTNVGAIIRSAAALGFDAVILAKGSSDPLYRRAARVSMGTVFMIPWTVTDDDDYIDRLNKLGFGTVAMALREDSFELGDDLIKKEEKLAVILGNEGNGLSESHISKCKYTVMIPMWHNVDSLNVSTAAALAFWELGKRK